MHEHADGYDDGLHAGKHPDLRHVPLDGQSDGLRRHVGRDGRADADAVRTGDPCSLGAGQCDGEGDEHASTDQQ